MRPIIIADTRPGERAWSLWSGAGALLLTIEGLYLLLVFLPVQMGDVNRLAEASRLGGGGYPLNWWRGDTSTLDPGVLYVLAQGIWLLLPVVGGPLLGVLVGALALTWADAPLGTRVGRGLLAGTTLAAFTLAWTTWGAALEWFYR